MTTNGTGLRSEAIGWTCEDGDEVRPGRGTPSAQEGG
jgi:hypothetical protein